MPPSRSRDGVSLADLARQAGMSPSYFLRAFRELYGVTPRAYLIGLRREQSRGVLARGGSITAEGAGQARRARRWSARHLQLSEELRGAQGARREVRARAQGNALRHRGSLSR